MAIPPTKSLGENFTRVLSTDPALDPDNPKFDLDKYHDTNDPEFLPLKEGKEPVQFVCRVLPPRIHWRILGILDDTEKLWEATAYGLRECMPAAVELEFEVDSKGYEKLTDDCLGALFYRHPTILMELGGAVAEASGAKLGKA